MQLKALLFFSQNMALVYTLNSYRELLLQKHQLGAKLPLIGSLSFKKSLNPSNFYFSQICSFYMNRLRNLGALWGVGGFLLLIGYAVVRLFEVFLRSLNYEWHSLQWVLLVIVVAFMAYYEGYKGFQLNYAPRLAARAKYLSQSGSLLEILLAPLFCMSFFRAPKKRIIVSVSLLIMIIVFVSLFRLVPQPWRGILDAGVVIGLSWGLISTVYFCIRILILDNHDRNFEPEIA